MKFAKWAVIILPYIILVLAYQQDWVVFPGNKSNQSDNRTSNELTLGKDPLRLHLCNPLRKGLSPILNEAGHCSSYFTDGKSVFHLGEEFVVTDKVNAFKAIGDSIVYSTDGANVFCNGRLLRGADPKSFTIFMNYNGEDMPFSADKNRLFYYTAENEDQSILWPEGFIMHNFWNMTFGTTSPAANY